MLLWSNISSMETITQEDVLSQSIRDNKFVTTQGKPIFEPILANKSNYTVMEGLKHGRQQVLSSIYPLASFSDGIGDGLVFWRLFLSLLRKRFRAKWRNLMKCKLRLAGAQCTKFL